jgi:hypothetical protein
MPFNKPDITQLSALGSTVGDVYFPKVTALLPFDGTNGATSTTDSSNSNHTVTFNGNASLSTAQSKFGGSSCYFDGTGDYLSFDASSNWDFGTGDFTIEFWVRFSVGSAYQTLWDYGYTASAGILIQSSNGSSPKMMVYIEGSYITESSSPSLSTWYHYAIVRSSGTVTIYRDGLSVASASMAGSLGGIGTPPTIGVKAGTTLYGLNGYLDDFRITKGLARYTSTFTPPTTAHLTSAGDVNKQIIVNSTADGVAIGTGGINQARIAKAWCKFTGTGTAAIDESYNVSSITDRGTGKYSVTFSTAMSSSDYSFTATTGGGADSWVGLYTRASTFSTTVATFTISYVYTSSNGGGSVSVGYNDGTDVSVVVFGN